MKIEFKELYAVHYKPVVRFFARNGVPEERQKDLASETFLRAYRGFPDFRGDAKPSTWLFRIARHVLYNARRDNQAAKRRGEEVSLEAAQEDGKQFSYDGVYKGLAGNSSDPLQSILETEKAALLTKALADLPNQMRYCVELRLQGLKYREIAAVQKISVETVKAHLFQARKRLKELLGEYFEQIEFGGES